MNRYLQIILLAVFLPCCTAAESGSDIYSTWENMEIDKCASAWFIKRFADRNASFKFFPKGELITEGIPFDVPEAEIRRYHNMSAFEYLLKKYNRKDDPALRKIGAIIHDIEINYWGKKQIEASRKINEAVQDIIETSNTPGDCLNRSFIFFDTLYSELKAVP